MATFEAAYLERVKSLKEETQRGKDVSKRVLVDPFISVDQIQTALEALVKHKKDTDLYRHIGAPTSCVSVNWQTPPHGEWMLKCCGLVWDFLSFCPNTKLASSKVRKALQQMCVNKSLSLPPYLGKPEEAIDRIDLGIRLVMNMFREVATKSTLKMRMLRSMSREDGLRLEMVLQKVHIPSGSMGFDSQESEESLGQSAGVLETPTPCRALVPERLVPEQEHEPEHREVHCPFKRLSVTACSSAALEPAPSIFQQVLQGTSAGSLNKEFELKNEAALLKAAQQYVAPQTQVGNKSTLASKSTGKKKIPKTKSKQEKICKPHAAPKAKSKVAKAKSKSKKEIRKKCPEYQVDEEPRKYDTYRNIYTSRHYRKAETLALKHGLSPEEAKAKGRAAGKIASAKWDAYRSVGTDVD